jgi:iron complex transport system substrate-binding protein
MGHGGTRAYPRRVRIVSLLPSATEIVYALGLDDELVGVTFECDEPAAARRDKTVVVGGRDTSAMTPAEIDAYVRGRMAKGEDLYTLHEGALSALDPDLILTQDLCRVCAIPSGDVQDALDHLGCRADVLALDPHTLEEVLETLLAVGECTGAAGQAGRVVDQLRARLDAVRNKVAGRPRPRVAVVEWVDPPFTAGHWVPDLVWVAGGEPVAASSGARSVETTWPAIAAVRPDVIVVAPCGYHLDGAATQAESVLDRMPPVPVWAIDADGIIVRPGPRVVDGVEALATALHGLPARASAVRLVRP